MKGRHSLETADELGNSARCDVFIGELFRGRFFQRPGPIRFQRKIFQEQSPVPRRTATFRIIHQAVVYAANEEIPRVQRQDVVAELYSRFESDQPLGRRRFCCGVPKRPFVRPATGLGGEGSLSAAKSILLVIWSPRALGYLWRREDA